MSIKKGLKKALGSFGPHTLRRYAQNLGWLGAEKALRFATGIWLAPWVASYLGPARYGIYEFSVSFVYLFTAFSFVGVNTLVVREFVSGRWEKTQVLGSGIALRVLGGLLAFMMLLGVASWGLKVQPDLFFALPENYEEFTLVALLGGNLILNSADIFTSFFQAKVQSENYVKIQFVVILLSASLKLYGILSGQETLFFIAILVVEAVTTAVGLALMYQYRERNLQKWRVRGSLFKNYFKESIPLIVSAIAITLYMRIDQVMVKEQLGNVASGHYAAAVRLSEMWYVFPTLLTSTLFPAIVEAKKESLAKYNLRVQQLTDLLCWASIAFSLGIQVTAYWIIVDILPYGEAYEASVSVLRIHVWAGVFVSLGALFSRWMIIEKIQHYSMWQTLMGAAANIALNWFFIPRYGLEGVAWATLISYAFGAMGLTLFLPKLYPLLRFTGKVLLAPARLLKKF